MSDTKSSVSDIVVSVKKCRSCTKTPGETPFPKHPGFKDGLDSICKACKSKHQRNRVFARTPEERTIALALDCEKSRRYSLFKQYGLTFDDYDAMLVTQNNGCKICFKTPAEEGKRLAVDHCHYSGKVRGLLCGSCNTSIGAIGDMNEGFTSNAIAYLIDKDTWIQPYATHRKSGVPKDSKDYELRRRFGITIEDYTRMYERQNGCCKICSTKRPFSAKKGTTLKALAVDHCHTSGIVRGLLCFRCNGSLGRFKDDADLLTRAARYLEGSL